MWWLTVIVGLILMAYLRIRTKYKYWAKRNVAYLKPVVVFGNSAAMILRRRSFVDQIKWLYNAEPDRRYFGMFQFMTPQLLIRDPELIKQITVKDFHHFTDRTSVITEEAEPIFAKNLVGLKGQRWHDMRGTLSPSFTSSKMKFLFRLISDCAEQFTTYYEAEASKGAVNIDVKDAFSRFTNDSIASAAFGITVDSLNDRENEFFLKGKDVTTFNFFRMLLFFGYSLFPSLMRYFKVPIFPRGISDFLRRIVRETIAVREEKGVVRPDMIHILLEASKGQAKHEDDSHVNREGFAAVNEMVTNEKDQKHQKSALTEDDIVAQAMIFFFGGFETSSVFMSFLAYEVALNPGVQANVQDEIDSIKSRCNGKITYEEVMAMKYLDMVVSEALRKWTPGVALDRICVKKYQIEPKQPGEAPLTIEKGTTVFIPVVGIHHDPQYFPDPDKFDPERFSDENKHNIVPFTYMPFGSGPRNCIASRFALMEAKILLCHLLAKFDIVPTEKTVIPMVLSKKTLTMQPDGGIWLGLKKRDWNVV